MSVGDWQALFHREQQQAYFQVLQEKVARARAEAGPVYPAPDEVFTAFRLTPLADVKVVILGQDPYHGPGQAHGLAFSVPPGVKPPPSLANIFKELQHDIGGFDRPSHGDLTGWAEQGVLLLNTVLTVAQGQAHSHSKWGWETFTDAVIAELNAKRTGMVFLLWGSHARKKGAAIDRNRHCVLEAPHPSPLSAHRGFFGCGHFSKANTYLRNQGQAPINWQP
ncbi:uracil-DNA glycosylase [Alteromonas sp. ASW11-19]|uniref:Uracil-DNA glycosylase n=1 Tax=Alteromonas salexigens TaxID=2982530 RepID=A0ABT2VTB8_9ALTE|nr:uracil-DNA glycosylase [Alteromonas salexigens]MCU7555491.1 uracil-DNA glycosylase [Alteromonas salexigens]